ncbi:MAG: hypothetical protein PVF33_02150 [Candidatus Latescibacterota bacterium]|jgi:hypothetical protein
MELTTIVILVHAAAAAAMCGLVWFVQIVHYPLFRWVGAPGFAEYEVVHSRLTSRVVAPLMLAEAVAAVGLTFWMPAEPLVWFGLGTLVLIWLSTFLLQVPQHRRLSGGFDVVAHRRLVRTNWLRTIGWSARAVIALALLPVAS